MENYSLETPEDLETTINRLRYVTESEEYEKLALKCIQKAQFFKNVDLEFEARLSYIRILAFLNKDDLTIPMFSWLLKKCDEDRERFDYFTTLWSYKWIINDVKSYSAIPLAKVEALYKDLEQRFRDYGTGEKVIHYLKLQYYDTIGQPEKAEEEYKLYQKATSNHLLDDCRACQPNNLAGYLLANARYEEVFEITAPIIRGEMTCHVVPETTYPKLIMAAIMLQRWEEAENFSALARKKLRMNIAHLEEAAYLITYYTVIEDFVKGRNILEKQFPFLLSNPSDVTKFYFLLAAKFFLEKFIEKKKKNIKLKLPPNNLLYQESSDYDTLQTLHFFSKQLTDTANALDKRNGNNFYMQFAEKHVHDLNKLNNAFHNK